MDVRTILAHECGWLKDFNPRTMVCQEKAGSGLFACRRFGKKAVVSYYGSLSYVDLGKESQFTKRYKMKYMEATAESFCGKALKLDNVATDSKGQRDQVCVVPASLCSMQYINNLRYVPGDENSRESRRLRHKTKRKAEGCSFEV